MNADEQHSEFEQRVSHLLSESAERLDGALRSRLTQARYRALESGARPLSVGGLAWRRWAPSGAAALAVLLMLGYLGRQTTPVTSGENVVAAVSSGGAADDLELLADNDAIELNQDGDYEFYEWASAASGSATVGS